MWLCMCAYEEQWLASLCIYLASLGRSCWPLMMGRLSSLVHCTSQTQILMHTHRHTLTQSHTHKVLTHMHNASFTCSDLQPAALVYLITSISVKYIIQFINSLAHVNWIPIKTQCLPCSSAKERTIYNIFSMRRHPETHHLWMGSCNSFLSLISVGNNRALPSCPSGLQRTLWCHFPLSCWLRLYERRGF